LHRHREWRTVILEAEGLNLHITGIGNGFALHNPFLPIGIIIAVFITIIAIEHGGIPDSPRAKACSRPVSGSFVIGNSQNHGIRFLIRVPEWIAGKCGNPGKRQTIMRRRKG
jgi:hypothetical protein